MWGGLVALALAWAAAILAAPTVRAAADGPLASGFAATTYVIGAAICHQRPERSFHVAGVRMPVCARCTALYLGGAIGLAGWALVRRSRPRESSRLRTRVTRALIVTGAPVVMSVVTSAAGIWDPSNAWRAAISAPLGLMLGAVLAAVTLEDLR